jgi:hypothetical protein
LEIQVDILYRLKELQSYSMVSCWEWNAKIKFVLVW